MNYEKYIGQTVTLPKGTAIYLHQYKTSIHPTKKKMKVILQEIEGEYFVYYDSRLYKNFEDYRPQSHWWVVRM